MSLEVDGEEKLTLGGSLMDFLMASTHLLTFVESAKKSEWGGLKQTDHWKRFNARLGDVTDALQEQLKKESAPRPRVSSRSGSGGGRPKRAGR